MILKNYDNDRYDRSKRIHWLNLELIRSYKVLVIGCGALGNEVCKNLALSGFRNIAVIDYDCIVKSNLNRCFLFTEQDAEEKRLKAEVIAERIKKLACNINIKYYNSKIEDLDDDFIRHYNIALGCLDNLDARLYLNTYCYYHKIPYIDSATNCTTGKVQVVIPPITPCLECCTNKTHAKIINSKFGCDGSQRVFYQEPLGAEITTTSIIAGIQIREALKIACKKQDMVIKNIFYYDGARNISEIIKISMAPNCMHYFLV